MPDLDDRRLDAAIRDLLGRAVADAPPAPMIDERAARPNVRPNVLRFDDSPPRDRRGWIVTAIAAASVAAAAVGLLVMGSPEDTAEAPAVQPGTTVLATFPTVPEGVTPTTLDAAQTTVAAPSTAPDAAPPETAPPTTADAVPAPADTPVMTSAGANGITEQVGAATPVIRYAGPAEVVANAGDGRIFFQPQRRWDTFDAEADTRLLLIEAGAVEPGTVALPAPLQGRVVLHDAATVAGEVVVIVERQPDGPCANPDDCDGSIWAFWPDRGEATELDAASVWEFGWSRLTLGTNGVIVGQTSSGPMTAPYSLVVPGSGATPVDFATLGLDESYADCATCPNRFAIDPSGHYVGWIESQPDGPATIVVVVAAVDGSGHVSAEVDSPLSFGDLDLDTQVDGSGSFVGRAAISGIDADHWSGAGPQPAVIVDLTTGLVSETSELTIEFGA